MSTPEYLYKILSLDDWGKTCGNVQLSPMDEAFIHLPTEEQLPKSVKKFWGQAPRYVVLKLETKLLVGELAFEANPGGTNKYYHLYNGSIPLAAIVEMRE